LAFGNYGGSEQMRLTSTGLGIGTSSVTSGYKLEAQNGTAGTGLKVSNTGGGYATLEVSSNATSVATMNFTNSLSLMGGNVGIGTSSPASKLDVSGTGSQTIAVRTQTSGDAKLLLENAGSNAGSLTYSRSLQALLFSGEDATTHMTLLSSGNLGIGTSSPAAKLDVNSTGAGVQTVLNLRNDADTSGVVGTAIHLGYASPAANYGTRIVNYGNPAERYAGDLVFERGGGTVYNESMRIDSSGNLGLGVTPSAWGSSYKAIQLAGGSLASFSNSALDLYSNAYDSGTGAWKYVASLAATRYAQSDGKHIWFNAPIGTAGNAISFSQAMTLDASGNLGVGTTSPTRKISIGGTTSAVMDFYPTSYRRYAIGSDARGFVVYDDTASAYRMEIDASGNLGLGVTPSAWYTTSKAIEIGYAGSAISSGGAGDIGIFTAAKFGPSTSFTYAQTGVGAAFYNQYNGAHIWKIAPSGTAGDAISFTQAMTLDVSGNLLVGTTVTDPIGSRVDGYAFYKPDNAIRIRGSNGVANIGLNASTGVNIQFFTDNGSAAVSAGNISSNGSTTTYNTSSDYRLKNVIGAVSGAGERIDALEPIEYEWKADGSRTRGFLAHQFQEVYASSVSGTKDAVDADGKPVYQSMQAGSSEVIADLVAEIQSLRARVAALEAS
jgi:hypothetical protein